MPLAFGLYRLPPSTRPSGAGGGYGRPEAEWVDNVEICRLNWGRDGGAAFEFSELYCGRVSAWDELSTSGEQEHRQLTSIIKIKPGKFMDPRVILYQSGHWEGSDETIGGEHTASSDWPLSSFPRQKTKLAQIDVDVRRSLS